MNDREIIELNKGVLSDQILILQTPHWLVQPSFGQEQRVLHQEIPKVNLS
jgi:hypothetical protein